MNVGIPTTPVRTMPEQIVLLTCTHESFTEHGYVHLDGRGDMPPDSITLTCDDVQVPIDQVDTDNVSMNEEDEFG
eukprot:11219174-Lingulodinium_polyedra.AAC.1